MKKVTITLSVILLIAAVFYSLKNNALKPSSPGYSTVFPRDKVIRLDIKMTNENWETMTADLESNLEPPFQDREMPPQALNLRPDRPMAKGHRPPFPPEEAVQGGRGQKMAPPHGQGKHTLPPLMDDQLADPLWGCCDITFKNQTWQKVGIRFKGNSSLRSTYRRGLEKFSFKLDFDRFEDEFPQLKNQRFYGFEQLNIKNNYDDLSFMREKLATDLFADFGLTTPKTAFCQLFVDYGEGPQYFGLYTLVEEVDDTVIKTPEVEKSGNLYKPEGLAASFAPGSFDTTAMNKKNHKQLNDYSDVRQLYEVLNSSLRTEDHKLWKSQLSEIFDVPVFLKWLAANTVMQNWDSYGTSLHNYYLYHNPVSNKLEWIPWDHNEALQSGKRGGALSLSLKEVDTSWPLIKFIIEDAGWKAEYENYVNDFSQNLFTPEKINPILEKYEKLIAPCVVGEEEKHSFINRDSDFFEAVEYLRDHTTRRQSMVQSFIQPQNL